MSLLTDLDPFAQAMRLASSGQRQEAAPWFARVPPDHPRHVQALNNLGALACERQAPSEALDWFVQALVADAGAADVRGNLAAVLQHRPTRRRAALRARTLALSACSDERAAAATLDELTGTFLPRGPQKPRMLFLEQEGISTARFLDPITQHFAQHFEVVYLKTRNVPEARTAIERADVVWLEWASELTAAVTEHVPDLRRKPVLCRLHGYEAFSEAVAGIRWEVVDQLVFVARHKQDVFNQRFPGARVEQAVVRNGVDLSRFTVAPGKTNTKKLVLLGHLNYRKGLPLLLQFFHELRRRDPDFHLYIRGTWQDERYRMYVLHIIGELGLGEAITFVDGWIPDLDAWLADKSHVLSFSLEESFHYAVGEGMSAGLRPIVHAWKEARDIWPDEHVFADLDGFLARALDSDLQPERYRQQLIERGLTEADQFRALGGLVGALL